PTRAVLPPAAAEPVSGWSTPILYGLACPNASRHGAGTSMAPPSAPAAAADRPRKLRRVVLPRHQMFFAQASSCHRSRMSDLLRCPWTEHRMRGRKVRTFYTELVRPCKRFRAGVKGDRRPRAPGGWLRARPGRPA